MTTIEIERSTYLTVHCSGFQKRSGNYREEILDLLGRSKVLRLRINPYNRSSQDPTPDAVRQSLESDLWPLCVSPERLSSEVGCSEHELEAWLRSCRSHSDELMPSRGSGSSLEFFMVSNRPPSVEPCGPGSRLLSLVESEQILRLRRSTLTRGLAPLPNGLRVDNWEQCYRHIRFNNPRDVAPAFKALGLKIAGSALLLHPGWPAFLASLDTESVPAALSQAAAISGRVEADIIFDAFFEWTIEESDEDGLSYTLYAHAECLGNRLSRPLN